MADFPPDPFPAPDPVRFPNTRRRTSASAMNGSTSRTSAPDMPSASEPDTCRICRGEGSPDEPLFYPCKCSGSIKYVHQDCLMEWLSHSQKKHCELCKTSFRFTKLYDPNMPKALPPHVFLRHTAKYLFQNLLVWLRAALVASVWLGWLPYLMRSVWSFLFWISDEGLGSRPAPFGLSGSTGDGIDVLSGTNVCPSSPLFAATTTVATIGGVIDSLPPESAKLVRSLYGINLTSTDPIYSTILRLLFGTVGLTEKPTAMPANAIPAPTRLASNSSIAARPSLLSEVDFLRNLTRHPSINRVVIAVLEGQIITMLVIVCFILIILVRDYVVQQQPEINMRAAFAGIDNAPQPQAAPAEAGAAEVRPPEAIREPPQAETAEEAEGGRYYEGLAADYNTDDTASEGEDPGNPSAPYYQELQPFVGESSTAGALHNQEREADLRQQIAQEIDRRATERLTDDARSTVNEYLDIYREAGGDPARILEIARERRLEARLDYWMRLTRSMMIRQQEAEAAEDQAGPSAGPSDPAATREGWEQRRIWEGRAEPEAATAEDAVFGDPSAGPSGSTEHGEDGSASKGKGKAKLVEVEESESFPVAGPLRPRANTDGPQINGGIHPLANNSWSFTDLPPSGWDESVASGVSATPNHITPITRPDESPDGSHGSQATDQAEAETGVPDGPVHGPLQAHEVGPARAEAPPRREPAGLVDRVADFMWREVDNIPPNELGPVNFFWDFPEIPAGEGDQGNAPANQAERDQEAAEAAAAAVDAEAIEDAEDIEGILELLGMQGPIVALFQNSIFCAFLVSMSIFLGVFVPYNLGRIAIWAVANPMHLARMQFSAFKFVQDCCVLVLGVTSSTVSESLHALGRSLGLTSVASYARVFSNASWDMAASAANRIAGGFAELPPLFHSDVRNFSAISHEALLAMKGHVAVACSLLWDILMSLSGGDSPAKLTEALAAAANVLAVAWEGFKAFSTAIVNPSSWVINLSVPEPTRTINAELAYWGGMDRFWAILSGYVTLSLAAGLYLRRGIPFSSNQAAQQWEASFIDGLKQASGVVKVILIISIEMLVFPLYCGMLLDVATLPLFEDTTLRTRLIFAVNYPVTSVFVHWFVGTAYMFHFALFVSMCRKVFRKGVLYFIRDPDDPEFHPVRDVLERRVTTQLRKIAFSALVYGALVVVCLGGVVWGLSLILPRVLPIHYSSNEPVLEFPVDLLFYNFIMPLAVRFFRPSDGLHAMYTWWFLRCARALRLTWFLFETRRIDEEGRLVLKSDSPDRNLPFWRQWFLEINAQDPESPVVVARTWRDILQGGTNGPPLLHGLEEPVPVAHHTLKKQLIMSGQLIPDGRWVRAPASDQVRIPRGARVFLEVTGNNKRLDGRPDQPEADIYSTKQYQQVYIPPHFRARIFLFILFIWLFAAVTGVGITIIPLVFGRWMLRQLIPADIRTNDVYAFSIGIHILGSAAYAVFHARSIYGALRGMVKAVETALQHDAVQRVLGSALRAARVVYTYFFVLVVFPLLAASLLELYALVPLHEIRYSVLLRPGAAESLASVQGLNPAHTIRVVQTWTLGLLFLRLGLRITNTWFDGSHVAHATRAVVRNGWLDPDVSIFTRAFVIPGLAMWLAAVMAPMLLARAMVADGAVEALIHEFGASLVGKVPGRDLYDAYLVLVYRLSFPAMTLLVACGYALWSAVGVFRGWQVRIRDEVYLIGERLHNFGGTAANGAPRAGGAWRAGGTRI
ncbi:putative E3 ubiquitin ligase SUD1 [Achaetomium macrosporum]|uniref:RING-type E3 ubiquitin transferase n=1 Tax=Achaetomium macrosporum TaxID=79813 RepID=A0AAN7CB23_9PEZI|nr:putative E3 ubiquitin ligase SUD1 [Achaetomium macrosporum]